MKQNEYGTSLGKTENLLINLTSNLDTSIGGRRKHQKRIYNLQFLWGNRYLDIIIKKIETAKQISYETKNAMIIVFKMSKWKLKQMKRETRKSY